MSGTKRIPLSRREVHPHITPRAIELFAEMERATRARWKGVRCTISERSSYCDAECPACEQWWAAHNALHDELRLRPWQWPAVPSNPYPPGHPSARAWAREVSRSDSRAAELYRTLRAASRAAHRAAKDAARAANAQRAKEQSEREDAATAAERGSAANNSDAGKPASPGSS
jgi:hypothetical protein